MEYICKIISGEPAWNDLPKAEINRFRWETNGYAPLTFANLCMDDDCFRLRLVCYEVNPTAVYTVDGSPVCKDSCMEFFFRPNGDERYINIEMNSNVCILSGLGTGRHGRIPIEIFGKSRPTVSITEYCWEIRAEIPFTVLSKIYGHRKVEYLEGNFFKCGDETPMPHYGMWSPSLTDQPDFHRPEYFGKIVLENEISL